ncbi:hydrolase [Saccharomonospora piscinae]|uniref:M15 family metallopeptidase n=1 Tax=Saccharomonospora piscinae TaxID=687388 RepID=UPI0011068B82|nr:M15 family metallopeptidase [Saccharomonospora piscinae]TLW91017.1 hydrolase [Saccharomonospora piscinae]
MRAFGLSTLLLITLLLWSATGAHGSLAEQRRHDSPSDAAWSARLDALAGAGIRPPPARALRDPSRLPPGLRPVPAADGGLQRGVASAAGVPEPVLPREVVAVVSAALRTVGAPYEHGGDGPGAFSCAGLVSGLYDRVGITVPATAERQWASGHRVRQADAVAGDLVIVGSDRYGVQSVGLIVGPGTMVVADATAAAVVTARVPDPRGVLGVVRPSLGPHTRGEALGASAAGSAPTWRCGGILPSSAAGQGGAEPSPFAWGGYPNGLIPDGVLCPLRTEPHALRCDAARDLAALDAAYTGALGERLCLTDSYRTLEMQLELHQRKPELAAEPGTSAHGWGVAVDLCGGAETFGTAEHDWLRAHAADFGWTHPRWAREGSDREEPWHWEYRRP